MAQGHGPARSRFRQLTVVLVRSACSSGRRPRPEPVVVVLGSAS
jgi:hypothetical protein